jgi:tetratricopeptide (TPR) repeat protein
VTLFVLLLSTVPAAQAFLFKGNVEKAREFVKANMADKAVELLKQEIEKNPANAEAHFELGAIYLDQGNYTQAEQRFKGAQGLDAKYARRITQKYMDSGKALMDEGKDQEAIRRFNMAIAHDPSLKPEVAELCYNKAKQILQGMTQNTDSSTSETV